MQTGKEITYPYFLTTSFYIYEKTKALSKYVTQQDTKSTYQHEYPFHTPIMRFLSSRQQSHYQ